MVGIWNWPQCPILGVSILPPTSILLYIIYSSLRLMYVHKVTVVIDVMFSLIRLNNHSNLFI